ncbi:MAG TPA: hypothetical protein EYN91_15560 [Candidatus Melainabacteria bacterium]|nr:hypothetical protein [Candidatus Melainabacteria bacterium]HIN65169.1 hypothetical protein [Candidatus Obscuribacterales bacterium]
MKSANAVLILIGVLVLGYLGLIASRPSLREMSPMEVLQTLLGDTKDSLRKEKFVSFKPAEGHYKVSFPGTPDELNLYNSWLHPAVIPLPGWFMADRNLGFYVSEVAIDNSDAPGRISAAAVDRPLMDPSGGNNEMVSQNSSNNILMEIQEFLDRQAETIVRNAGATLFSKVPAAAGGGRYFGRSIEGSAKTPGQRYRLQIFYDSDNHRLFAIGVSGKPEEIHCPQANQFLGSLQILP